MGGTEITQEVREFAATQAAKSSGDRPRDDSRSDLKEFARNEAAAEAGMAEMIRRYRENGGQIYSRAG